MVLVPPNGNGAMYATAGCFLRGIMVAEWREPGESRGQIEHRPRRMI